MEIDRIGQVYVRILSDSRSLGLQVVTDALVQMDRVMASEQPAACLRAHPEPGRT